MSTQTRSIALCGATGLVGGACLRLLCADVAFDRVVVLTRRALPGNLLQGPGAGKIGYSDRLVDPLPSE